MTKDLLRAVAAAMPPASKTIFLPILLMPTAHTSATAPIFFPEAILYSTFVAETQYFGSRTSSAPCTLATGAHCTSTTDCWQKIWTDAVNHSGDGSPAMIFRDNQGGIATFTHVES